MKYVFIQFRPEFLLMAQGEIALLHEFLPQAQIEHFGSTAIPGVGGKGIIDMYVAVSKEQLKATKLLIEQNGYEYKPSGGVPNERWFYQTDKKINNKLQRFHLHLTYIGNQNMVDSLAFRDYLRNHPKEAKAYEVIKVKAAKAALKYAGKADQKKAYMDVKSPVILKIMEKIALQSLR